MLTGPQGRKHRDYWVRELDGPRSALALPCDRPYDPKRMPRVEVATMRLSPTLAAHWPTPRGSTGSASPSCCSPRTCGSCTG